MSVYKCVYPCFEQWAQTRITRAWATEREWPYHRKTTMTSTQESRITWQERGSQVGRGLVATGCTHDAAARQGSLTNLSLPPLSHLDRVQYCILPVRCFRDHRYYTRTQRLLSPYSITERAVLYIRRGPLFKVRPKQSCRWQKRKELTILAKWGHASCAWTLMETDT